MSQKSVYNFSRSEAEVLISEVYSHSPRTVDCQEAGSETRGLLLPLMCDLTA